ncbi:MAG: hypothetical protein CL840_18155 [Crocinitomicaceae bacterium]|nr:hypothetical protein [Crocinitomicaceae bacterium]|tara:strand:- start:10161 stop:10607 length:447 start_codon:yes stop_codon:yes gene_type:complete
MSFQEKKSLVTMLATVIIVGFYCIYVFGIHSEQSLNPDIDFQFWGITALLILPTIIVVNIISHILFGIFYTITANEKPTYDTDERDKLVELRSNQNSFMVFTFGYMLSMVSLALGWPAYYLFNILIISQLLSSIMWSASNFYYYKRGF